MSFRKELSLTQAESILFRYNILCLAHISKSKWSILLQLSDTHTFTLSDL